MAIQPLIGSSSLKSLTRTINQNTTNLLQNFNRLATGQRINRASDDAAGLAISEQLRADIASSQQALQNVNVGTALTNTAEGALSQVSDLLVRGRELAVQAGNGILTDAQRANVNREFTAIRNEIDRITGVAEFNGQPLLNGDLGPQSQNRVDVQAGPDNTPANRINLNVVDATNTATLGINTVDLGTQNGALNGITALDNAIRSVNNNRASLGAIQNRLESAGQTLGVRVENFTAAESSIRNLDFASEISKFQGNNLLTQISTNLLNRASQFQQAQAGGLFQSFG